MSRCEDEQMWEKVWRWADVKMSRCERRCEDEQMWRWADVREDVKMSRCERRCERICKRRCERRCEDEQMWEKMWERCERRCEDEQMWRWADVKMSRCERRCEDEKMWEKMRRWADVKMSRCEDEQMWRWTDVKMRRCEDEKMRYRCEDEKMWRWEDKIQTPTIGRTLRSDALGKTYSIYFNTKFRKYGNEWTALRELQACLPMPVAGIFDSVSKSQKQLLTSSCECRMITW